MTNLVEDVATLTTINKKSLQKLLDIAVYCINETIEEDVLASNGVSEIDLGIGELYIQYVNNELKFKFIPSAKLKEGIIDTIKGKQNNLEITLEKTLVDKITHTYKDII